MLHFYTVIIQSFLKQYIYYPRYSKLILSFCEERRDLDIEAEDEIATLHIARYISVLSVQYGYQNTKTSQW